MLKKEVIERINNWKNMLLYDCYEGKWERAIDDFSALLQEISNYTFIADSPKFYIYDKGIESITEVEDEQTGYVHYKDQNGKNVYNPIVKKIDNYTKESIQDNLQLSVNHIKESIMMRDVDTLINYLSGFFDNLGRYVIIPDWPEIEILDREEARKWMNG